MSGVSAQERERRRLWDQERLSRAREEERALQAHFEALADLEAGRGGRLRREGGRVRADGRDGLLSLFQQGVIGEAAFGAGLLYRNAFEIVERGPRSQLARDPSGPSGPAEAMAWAERRSHLFGRMKAMEALAPDLRALWCLRLCAGEGRTIRSLAGGGRGHARATAALQTVLEAIAEANGLKTRAA